MKHLKRILSGLFLAALLLSCLAGSPALRLEASAATVASGTCGENLTWTLDDAGTLTISGTGPMSDFTSSRAPWYDYLDSIETAVIENGVTSIGEDAFYSCYCLTSVTIPESVTAIGSHAFSDCSGLASITLPSSVTTIGSYAFSGSGLKSITIPKGVTAIADWTFGGCNYLTSVTLPNSVTIIGHRAFYYCNSLRGIILPNALANIGDYAFYYCDEMATVSFCGTTAQWNALSKGTGWDDGCYFTLKCLGDTPSQGLKYTLSSDGTYYIVSGIGTCTDYYLRIPSTYQGLPVKEIGSKAFIRCSGITLVDIPDSITSIGSSAFDSCTGLTSLTIPDSVTNIGSGAFTKCTGFTSFTIPESVTTIGSSAFQSCTGLTSIAIPESVTSIGNSTFSGCTGLTSIAIPEGVSSIGNSTFSGCTGLTTIAIPESVTSIGNNAFQGCAGLTAIDIPQGVTSIGNYAFQDCTGLTSIAIPEGVSSIGSNAFQGCTGLTSITIPKSVTSIGSLVFRNCTALAELRVAEGNDVYHSAGNCIIETSSKTLIAGCKTSQIPADASVTAIGNNAFRDCVGLTSIVIPDSVTSIGANVFAGCSGLESITIPFVGNSKKDASDTFQYPFGYLFGSSSYTGGVATQQHYYGSSTDTTTSNTYYIPASLKSVTVTGGNILRGAFYNCAGLTSITLPESVNNIGNYAFYGCSGLASFALPEGVTGLGRYAFYGCSSLPSIVIPDSVTSIGTDVFAGCSGLESITIPFVGDSRKDASSTNQYPLGYLFGTSSYTGGVATQQYYYGSSTDTTTGSTYYIPASLKSVTVTGGEILYGAFYNCGNLTSVTMPDGIAHIGDHAFQGCTGLTSFTIPDSVTTIGDSAFSGCSSLTCLTISDSVTSIGSSAFRSCPIQKLIIAEGSKTVTSTMVVGENTLQEVVIPESVTSIGDSAFSSCKGLTTVTIPEGVTAIGNYAFSSCSSLTSVTIPQSVKSIGNSAFNNCTNLTGAAIPEGVTEIAESLFSGCSNLTSVTIPNSVTRIGDYAFQSCIRLTSVTIPEGVTSIGNGAFQNCDGLTTVVIPEGVTSIAWRAFNDCTNLATIAIPESVTSVGYGAFNYCTGLTDVFYSGKKDAILIDKSNDPLNNAKWHYEVIRLYLGDQLTFLCPECNLRYYCDATIVPLDRIAIAKAPDKLFYRVNEPVLVDGLEGISLQGVYSDGVTIPLGVDTIEAIAADLSAPGKKEVLLTAKGLSASFEIYVHDVEKSTAETTLTNVDPALYPNSSHDYGNMQDFTKTFSYPGALSLQITFSTSTKMYASDYIYIYDGNGNQIGKYTRTQAAGLTLTIPGDTFKVRLTSDYSYTAYGYSFSSILAETDEVFIHPAVIDAATATCTQPGLTEGSHCEICGQILVAQQAVAALGHSYTEEVTANATCAEAGSKTFTCSKCPENTQGHSYTEEIPALGHTEVIDPAVAPTCTSTGLTEGSHCEICGEILIDQEPVASPGHIPAEAVLENEVASTCSQEGSYDLVVYCSVCMTHEISRETKSVDALPHTEVIDAAVAPTCAATGLTEGKHCSVCGEVIVSQEVVDALDHTEAEAIVENHKDPTCTAEGSYDVVVYCSVCKKELSRKTDTITSPGHTEVIDAAVAPTCSATGLTEGKHCSACNKVLVPQTVVDALDHTYTQGVCTGCGEKDPTYVAGVTLSGSYKSFGSANETITIQLFRGSDEEAAYTFTNEDAPAASGSWSIEGIAAGSYTVQVSKKNHVTREYELTVGSDAIALDVEVWLTGDVTGDGLVNFSDYSKVLSQSKKPNSQILTDYAFLCGDVTGDGTINFADYSKVLSQAKGKGSLWQ